MINFDLLNIAALAEAAGVGVRALQIAVQKFKDEGRATPSLIQAMNYCYQQAQPYNDLSEVFTEQNIAYLEAMRRGLGWDYGKSLAWALVGFYNSNQIEFCPKCKEPICAPIAIPIHDETTECVCNNCGTVTEMEL